MILFYIKNIFLAPGTYLQNTDPSIKKQLSRNRG